MCNQKKSKTEITSIHPHSTYTPTTSEKLTNQRTSHIRNNTTNQCTRCSRIINLDKLAQHVHSTYSHMPKSIAIRKCQSCNFNRRGKSTGLSINYVIVINWRRGLYWFYKREARGHVAPEAERLLN